MTENTAEGRQKQYRPQGLTVQPLPQEISGQRIGNRQFYCNRGCNDICCVGTMEKKGKKEQ
jgi:hypothetical protein